MILVKLSLRKGRIKKNCQGSAPSACIGFLLGVRDGFVMLLGFFERVLLGLFDGFLLGFRDGCWLGMFEGFLLGVWDGFEMLLGFFDGFFERVLLGFLTAFRLFFFDGFWRLLCFLVSCKRCNLDFLRNIGSIYLRCFFLEVTGLFLQ